MSRDNGSIIGVANTPTTAAASGVWSLSAVALAEKGGIWPLPDLYTFTTALFRTPINGTTYSGATSSPNMFGPTQAELQSYYNSNSTILANLLSANVYFKVPIQGYQWWVVPSNASYTIVAHGAPGGPTSVSGQLGCKLTATFSLSKGEIIWILVGQSGSSGNPTSSDYCGAGGGGATVVAKAPSTGGTSLANITTCLLMAAGGRGPREGRFSPSTPTASSSANGTTGGGFNSFKAGGMSGAYGGYNGLYGYGGFGGGTASDDQEGGSGGYDSIYSGAANSFVDGSGTNVIRLDIGDQSYNLPGYVQITKI